MCKRFHMTNALCIPAIYLCSRKLWKDDEEFLCFLTAPSWTGTRQHSVRWTGFFFSCLRTNCRRFLWWGYCCIFSYLVLLLNCFADKKKKRKELNLELVPVTDSLNVLKSIVRHWDCYLIWQVRPTKAVNKSLRCHISSRCQDQVVKLRFSCKPLCLYMCTCTVCCCSCSHRRRWLWGASRSCSWASDSGNVGMWGSTVRTRARGGDFLKNSSLFFSFTWASLK